MSSAGPHRQPSTTAGGEEDDDRRARHWIAVYDGLIAAETAAVRRMRARAAEMPRARRLALELSDIGPLEALVVEWRSRRELWRAMLR